ncbi:MAG: hypothetical protein HKN19_15550 [Halioglobus sp.]|nr:hypothetical protein [Halioglobus sp.]
MHRFRNVFLFIASLVPFIAGFAQASGEASELTPEQVDAAFTAEDTAREASRRSKTIRPRDERSALQRLGEEADLIFHGTVHSQQVHYRGNDIPFTHTTFDISDLVKGEVDGGFFTLVQEGGPDRYDAQKILLVSTSEYFATGEEEVLFVAFDAATGTHMVRERFRILDGLTYNANGRGVVVEQGPPGSRPGLRLTGGRSADARFRTVPFGTTALYKRFGDDTQNPDGAPGAAAATARGVSPAQGNLGSSVGDIISALQGAGRVQP